MARLIERARARLPDDVGLCRRHYQLELTLRRDPRAAYGVARDALTRRLADPLAWQLRARAALALFDEVGLRSALLTAHALSPAAASRMAHVLSERARGGADYERAEWAQLAAQRLVRQSSRARRAAVSLPLPLAELPRLLAYLAQSQLPQLDLGVHLLATADQLRASDDSRGGSELPWVEDTSWGARPAVMLAATSWDDTQLRALGSALARRSDDGGLELMLGFEAIGARQRTTLLIAGRREGATLRIEQLSASLSRLDWSRVERLLAAPLRALVGATFPPDELAITALDASEAARIASAAQAASTVTCAFDGPIVRCRGPLSDAHAARRALLGVTAALLHDEAAALWSGTD